MSLSRSLVDLYVLASAASKVGASALASQTSSVCLHVKTSSLLNPTPVIDEVKIDGTPEIIKPVEVPLSGYVKKDSIPEPSNVTETSVKGFAEQNNASLNETMQNVSEKVVKEEAFDLDPTKSQYTVREPSGGIAVDINETFTSEKRKELKESRIPTSRFGRLWNYGTLATGMGIGAINESFKRATGLSQESSGKQKELRKIRGAHMSYLGSVLLSESNVNRLVEKLSRMRGAALKMGQMLSIQGIQAAGKSSGLPPQLEQVLLRVHDSANYMPQKQMEKMMSSELGSDWKTYFKEFDPIPIAAASIGQVHAATLSSNNQPVVIKIQYPGVAESIDSDLSNLKALVTFSNLLPRGLYLDNTIKVTKEELSWECDYEREADNGIRFKKLLEGDDRYKVPTVYKDLSTKRVLVSERLYGKVLSRATEESQELRNQVQKFRGRKMCSDKCN